MENEDLNPTNAYENDEIKEIGQWKNAPPSIVKELLDKGYVKIQEAIDEYVPDKAKEITSNLINSVSNMIPQQQIFGVTNKLKAIFNGVIPIAAIQGALNFASTVGKWCADENDILRDANVAYIDELRAKDLALSDKLANEVHNWAIGIATAEGGIAGFMGLPGMVIDIPTLITFSLRTIHKIGLCYGYKLETPEDIDFAQGILGVAGASSIEEKVVSLGVLRSIEVTIAKQTWKKMAEIASEKIISKQAVILFIKDLAKELGYTITKRKALESIPIIGLAIGAGVNGEFVRDVGWAARRAFQERWLIDNHKVIDI